jgi:hypothetical protein
MSANPMYEMIERLRRIETLLDEQKILMQKGDPLPEVKADPVIIPAEVKKTFKQKLKELFK